MIGTSAFAAGLTVFLIASWLAGALSFLAPYKAPLFSGHGTELWVVAVTLYVNLWGFFYWVSRLLFLRDTGRKLSHVDQQLATADSVHQDLRTHLESRSR